MHIREKVEKTRHRERIDCKGIKVKEKREGESEKGKRVRKGRKGEGKRS
jgi:hypothetical protein